MLEAIKMKPDYRGTLMSIKPGQTKEFSIVGRTYNAFMTAKSRIHKKGIAQFVMKPVGDTMFVTRIR